MPVIKVTHEFTIGLAIPPGLDVVIKTLPGTTLFFDIRGGIETLHGAVNNSEKKIPEEAFLYIPSPMLFLRLPAPAAMATIADITFI